MTLPVRTMRAAILARSQQPLIIDEVELPAQLGVGQVLVKIHHAGVCGSQVGEIDAVKGADRFLPHLLGHEGSGQVVAVGPGVHRVGSGDHVVLHWRKASGIEAVPAQYRWSGGVLNAGWVTTLSEYAVVSENRVTAIPADLDLGLAPLLGCAVTTGLGVVCNDARLQPAESVVVIGAGGVGCSVVMAADLVSADPIVVLDRSEGKLELARALGATHGLLVGHGDVEAQIRAIVGAGGADVVVENSGATAMIQLAVRLTHARGRTILVGVPLEESAALPTLELHFGKQLIGSHGGSADPEKDIPRCIALYRNGRLPLDVLVTERCRLDDVNAAIERMRHGAIVGRCVVDIASA